MTISEIMQECFSKLSLQWFEKIRNEFYTHPFFRKEKQIVSGKIIVMGENGSEEVPIDMTLENYCWDNSINHSWFNFEDIYGQFNPEVEYTLFRPTAKQFTQPIIDALQNYMSALNTVQEKNKIIKSVITSLSKIKSSCQIKNKSEYDKVLDYIAQKINDKINSEFSGVISIAEEIESYPDKILLNINQNELTILILLLYCSDIIDASVQPELFARKIISNHFMYKQGGTGEYAAPASLDKLTSDFKSKSNPSRTVPLSAIKQKIALGFSKI